jgi:DNA-binding response OmpR family regulator
MLMTVKQDASNSKLTNTCPHCGAKTGVVAAVELGEWRLMPAFATYRGGTLRLTGAEALLLYALGRAGGDVVDPVTLGQQFSISEDCANSVRVLISRLRKKLGVNCPIQTIRGLGYRWR